MLKRKSKRVLSIVLAVAMIVGLFPIAAFADEGTTPAEAKTIYVNASATEAEGTNNTYTTLAAAVNAASAGDIIELQTNVTLDGAGKEIMKAWLPLEKISPSMVAITLFLQKMLVSLMARVLA